jgi:hypothetical protein
LIAETARNDLKDTLFDIFELNLRSILEFVGPRSARIPVPPTVVVRFHPVLRDHRGWVFTASCRKLNVGGALLDLSRKSSFSCAAILEGVPTSVCDGYNNVSERAHRCMCSLKASRRAQTAQHALFPSIGSSVSSKRHLQTPPHQQPPQLRRTHSTHTHRLPRTVVFNRERKSGGVTSPQVHNSSRTRIFPWDDARPLRLSSNGKQRRSGLSCCLCLCMVRALPTFGDPGIA